MIIYVDENVPLKITRRLKAEGYQVEYVTRRVEDRDILETGFGREETNCWSGFFAYNDEDSDRA